MEKTWHRAKRVGPFGMYQAKNKILLAHRESPDNHMQFVFNEV
jgi:hypothetical protein